MNHQNNSWTVIKEFPTTAEIKADPTVVKEYEASLWVRKDESMVFNVKFGEGSHMNITWSLETDANDHDSTLNDDCKTKAEATTPQFDPAIAFRYGIDNYIMCTHWLRRQTWWLL